jgi:4-diphosphocytidyl-2-C-methyl-D-erythritol kinase
MTETLRLESPAKVNLRLEILRRREDGYHELRTILQKISLYDTLAVSLKKEKGVSISTNHPELPVGRENLVYRAAQMILKKSEYGGGVHIDIRKEIPLGARIIAISDSYDSMTSARPYRKPLGVGEAKSELSKWSGKQFDPRLVSVFLDLLKEETPNQEEAFAQAEEKRSEA